LSEKIQQINALNEDEIKNRYNEQIRKPLDESKKGAGLGLLEIARKSIGKIDFEIENFDEKFAFLVLSVKIKKGE
jgi:hypothetical protein